MNKLAFNCIIIEDERDAAVVLEHHIAQIPSLQLTGKYRSISSANNVLNTENIDLIFLDINLPGISGIEYAKTIHTTPAIIFTTAYPDYAIEGYEVDAVDFLLKPVSFERFSKAVNKFLRSRREQVVDIIEKPEDRQFVYVKSDRRLVKVFIDQILYVEAQRNALLLVTDKETIKTYHSIAEMEEKLPEELFLRIHRSFIISLHRVNSFSASTVIIQHYLLPIGRLYKNGVLKVLEVARKVL